MDTVIILLKVGLILYAIYSFIVYATRRSGNKSALKDFRERPVLRRITDEEKSALQPFLIGQGIAIEDDVRELSGAFLRHGLQTQARQPSTTPSARSTCCCPTTRCRTWSRTTRRWWCSARSARWSFA
jgi:hypothetical protein